MRIHYHTDCHSFAGCEQMLVVLLSAAEHEPAWQPTFSYRAGRRYHSGAAGRLPDWALDGGLHLPDASVIRETIGRVARGRLLRALKAATYALPLRQLFQIWDVAVLYRVLRRTKPNILHVNNGGFPGSPSCNAAVVSARLARVPVIVYVVNNLATGYGSPLRWGDWPLDRLAAKWVTTFVTGSRAAAEALRCVLPVGDDRVRTLHNGIAVRTPDETPAQTRARLGLMGDDIVILVVARLEPRKGHTFLIEAFARLHPPAAARAVLVIEGDGPEEARLREQASRLGLGDRVRFVGSERKVFNTMAAADIVALPSVAHEDFPNVVIEAMALGRPVVASRIAGTPEQVLDGETGFLVPPGDAGALASAAERLLLDPALRVAMGRAGQARFAEAFTAESAAARYWALYREFAARARHQSRAR